MVEEFRKLSDHIKVTPPGFNEEKAQSLWIDVFFMIYNETHNVDKSLGVADRAVSSFLKNFPDRIVYEI